MALQEDIVERWKTRLAEVESTPTSASPHRLWMRKVYARIYRFLLACYGQACWHASDAERVEESAFGAEEDVAATEPLTSTLLVDALKGKPAKDAAQIGRVLEAVHEANVGSQSDAQSGHSTAAASKAMWIRAAEFKDVKLARRFQRLLLRHGIESQILALPGGYFVEVQRVDLDISLDLHRRHRSSLRHNAPRLQQLALFRLTRLIVGFGALLLACAIPLGVTITSVNANEPLPLAAVAVMFAVSTVLAVVALSSILYRQR